MVMLYDWGIDDQTLALILLSVILTQRCACCTLFQPLRMSPLSAVISCLPVLRQTTP